ncbi:hypothetical protein QFC21_005728 [Naganishia friedmannii]|uniref:Uncharacterized protein n=1 Tax=Naganishia friedmannii TaxID=89922 RepID=A0ACC2V7U2_9TREE|nr:hypothetical protein QFC21_005728 [Naganishia friedmannii]
MTSSQPFATPTSSEMLQDAQKNLTTVDSTASIDLLTATIEEVQQHLTSGTITSVQLCKTYLARIEANNRKGLELRAVMETPPVDDLLAIARSHDEMRNQGTLLGKLHGIPLPVKDNIGTDPKLGMKTTAGSYALLNSIPVEDSTVIAKLRAAGAIILGKTTMCELGHYRTSAVINPCHGWSSRGGQGRSAYVAGGCPEANPGGSSSGSAIAVSAGFAPAALGTDTIGSLIAPAGRAAEYTLRSTVGLISRYGVVPASRHLDTVGPIAKSVCDAAILLECMSGYDPKDPATVAAQLHTPKEYTKFTKMPHATFRGKRLGVPRIGIFDADLWGNTDWRDAKVKPALDAAIRKMEALGASICDPADLPSYKQWKASMRTDQWEVVRHGLKEGLAEYLSGMQSTDVHSLRGIIELKLFRMGYDYRSQPGSGITTGPRTRPVERICGADGIEKLLEEHHLDALVTPNNEMAWCYAAFGGAVAAVPLGVHENGEPFGFCFLGRKWSEPMLVSLMAAYEANFAPRAVPTALKHD